MLSVGDRLGDFRILARLKAGGMATLYLAQRQGAAGFAKYVAIKLVHQHLAEDATFVRMFVDEALLSAKIQHPNVVHVEELAQTDGNYFLVMEFVHGVSLASLVKTLARSKRRLAPEVAVSIAAAIADGLHAAHETRGEAGELLGVVHRDVSPQNVLLSYNGHVKLIDFGIAKVEGRQSTTAAGSLKGKFRYMSPEQASGLVVDRRSDIYSLGIVLWEMLTGKALFEATHDIGVLDKVRHPNVDKPSVHVPSISPELDACVMAALSPAPEDRPISAQFLRRMLVESVPQSRSVDASHLSELVRNVMAGRLERERSTLPPSLFAGFSSTEKNTEGSTVGQLPGSATAAEEELATTIYDENLGAGVHDVGEIESNPLPVARSVTVQRARRSQPWLAVGAAIGILLGVGVAAWRWTTRRAPPEPAVRFVHTSSSARPRDVGVDVTESDAGSRHAPGTTLDAGSSAMAADSGIQTGGTASLDAGVLFPPEPRRTRRGKRPSASGPLIVPDEF